MDNTHHHALFAQEFATLAGSFDFSSSASNNDSGYDSAYSSNYDSSYDSAYDSAYDSNFDYDSNLDYDSSYGYDSGLDNLDNNSLSSLGSVAGKRSFDGMMEHPNKRSRHIFDGRLDRICEEPENNQVVPAGSTDSVHHEPLKFLDAPQTNLDAFLASNFQLSPVQAPAIANTTSPVLSFGEQLCSTSAFADVMMQASAIPRQSQHPSTQSRPHPRPRHQPASRAQAVCPENPTNLFELKTPLRPKQRKSYEHENRYLNPNPVVGIKDLHKDRTDLKITSGIVSVELVDVNGESLPDKQRLLGSSSQGALHLLLNPYNLSSTRFQLKIFENSRGHSYRLKFHVTYVTEDKRTEQEVILSNAFQVESNKKKSRRSKPTGHSGNFDS